MFFGSESIILKLVMKLAIASIYYKSLLWRTPLKAIAIREPQRFFASFFLKK